MTTVVRIDPTLCRGHAICALYLLDGVEIDRWGFGRVVQPTVAGRRAVRRALRAVAACPNGAVVIEEREEPTDPGFRPFERSTGSLEGDGTGASRGRGARVIPTVRGGAS